jgi:hypothetical protein
MAKQVINIGTMADNKSGDPLRTAFTKVNANFDELYARPISENVVSTGVHGQESGVPTAISAVGVGLQYGTTYTYGNTQIIIDVTDGSVSDVTIQKAGDGRTQGETFVITGDQFGGISPENDVTVTIDAVTDFAGPVVIDLTKNIHVLESGRYELPDGVEGQVIHFIPKEGVWIDNWGDVWVVIENCRYGDSPVNADTVWWAPFYRTTENQWGGKHLATAVFAGGAWAVDSGAFD